jgi:hypothetical protein
MWDLKEAQNTARIEVEKIIEDDAELSRSEVGEIHLERENELFWTFEADVPKLIKEGWMPGAITVLIDKKDGHVWTEEEQADFHKNWENTRRRAGFLNRK